jgi:hypothetical protein
VLICINADGMTLRRLDVVSSVQWGPASRPASKPKDSRIALAGLIMFAMMVIIVMQMKLQISPD